MELYWTRFDQSQCFLSRDYFIILYTTHLANGRSMNVIIHKVNHSKDHFRFYVFSLTLKYTDHVLSIQRTISLEFHLVHISINSARKRKTRIRIPQDLNWEKGQIYHYGEISTCLISSHPNILSQMFLKSHATGSPATETAQQMEVFRSKAKTLKKWSTNILGPRTAMVAT